MDMSSASPPQPPPSAPLYCLPPTRFLAEDILFCVDIDVDVEAPAEIPSRPRTIRHFKAIEVAVRHFVHAKLTINPAHRFAISTIGASFSWVRKEFYNEAQGIAKAFKLLQSAGVSCDPADLTGLFQAAEQAALKSRAEGRLLRVVLIYCRSKVPPVHRWPVSEKYFTMDVVYLHDKPGPDNHPQQVFDDLVNASELVSEYESYILESSQAAPRTVCRFMYMLLCHPQQRCCQEQLDIPKNIARRLPPAGVSNEDSQSSLSFS